MDDDTTQRRSGHLGHSMRFTACWACTMVACNHLGGTIRGQDVAGTERAAIDAVESWLAMRRALRKRELDGVDRGPRLQTARSATRAYRRTLADLLDRAQAQLDVTSLHQRLVQLRLSLAIANDECGGQANDGREDDPSGGI